jgi:hypothetical protein
MIFILDQELISGEIGKISRVKVVSLDGAKIVPAGKHFNWLHPTQ